MNRSRLSKLLAAALGLLGSATMNLHAETLYWWPESDTLYGHGGAGGNWAYHDGTNWLYHAAPTAADGTHFSWIEPDQTVTFAADGSAGYAWVLEGSTTFVLNNHDWTIASGFWVGDSYDGTADFQGGGTVQAGYLRSGISTGNTGTLSLSHVTFSTSSGYTTVGASGGTGVLNLNAGGVFLGGNNLEFVVGYGGNGTVNVQGTSASFVISGTAGSGEDEPLADLLVGWSDGNTPGTGVFTLSEGSASVGDDLQIGNATGDSGSVNISNGSQLTVGDMVGVAWSGTGSLDVSTGGSLTAGSLSVGVSAGGNGSVAVDGAGALLHTEEHALVGFNGTGSLAITNGGTVDVLNLEVAANAGSLGSVTVDGAGSELLTSGYLSVGDSGEGTLAVSHGGLVDAETSVFVGYDGESHGEVSLESGSSLSAGQIYVGASGTGTLTVSGGSTVSNAGAFVGFDNGSSGTVLVTGDSSVWTTTGDLVLGGNDMDTSTTATVQLTISDAGTVNVSGTARIHAGGTVNLETGGSLQTQALISSGTLNGNFVIAHEASATITGAGAIWNTGGILAVGSAGRSELTIADGGSVSNTEGSLGVLSDSEGSATVTGAGSSWTNSSGLRIGFFGEGDLTIADGGSVSNTFAQIGDWAGSQGSVTVTGNHSTWTNSNNLWVGSNGNGALTISDGGGVSGVLGVIGGSSGSLGTVTVTDADSTWTNSDALIVGNGGTGILVIENGGSVANTNSHIGYSNGASGSVTVTGTGSLWTSDGNLVIAGSAVDTETSATGVLTVEDGGAVLVTGVTRVHEGGTLFVAETGMLTTDDLLSSGELVVLGSLSVANGLTVAGNGLIEGSGTVVGDLTLEAGASFQFDLNSHLTVTGLVSLDSSFSIASLVGLDSSVDIGTYTLINGTATDFAALDIQNWGIANAYDLGDGKLAFFQQGSLEVVVIPEPATAFLLMSGLGILAFRRPRRG